MRGVSRYRAVLVRSAESDQLVLLLHERALADLQDALTRLSAGQIGAAEEAVHHARRIFSFLRHSLDPRVDAGLAEDLGTVYQWAHDTLAAQPAPIHAVARATRSLLDAFRVAIRGEGS